MPESLRHNNLLEYLAFCLLLTSPSLSTVVCEFALSPVEKLLFMTVKSRRINHYYYGNLRPKEVRK